MSRRARDTVLTEWGQAVIGTLAGLAVSVLLIVAFRACQENPAPLVPSPVVETVGKRVAPVAAVEPVATTARPSPLAVAIYRIPSSGHPSPVEAAYLAGVIEETWGPDHDLFMIAALAHVESGFAPEAIETRKDGSTGVGRGLFQLSVAYLPPGLDPFDVRAAARETKRKHDAWLAYHRREVNVTPHEFLSHHFCGFVTEGCRDGAWSAAKVRRTAERMRAIAAEVSP